MPPTGPGLARVPALLWRARLALAWERLWPALWPTFAVLTLFIAVALFDLLPRLHWLGHGATLLLFGAALGIALWYARDAFRLPDPAAARRRVETASGLAHRPLATLDDRLPPGSNDAMAQALWAAHRARVARMLASLRAGWPHPGMAMRDPLALRVVLGLVLIVAVAVGGDRAGRNFARALSPGVETIAALPGTLDLWITPPAYTGLPPVLPRLEANEIVVPVGSQVIAQVAGGKGQPRLVVDTNVQAFAPMENVALAAAAPAGPASLQAWRVAADLKEGQRLTIEQGNGTLASWALRLIPDAPPTVEFAAPPQRNPRAAVRMEYRARDDYGLSGVVAEIRRPADAKPGPGAPIDLALPLAALRAKESTAISLHDLTSHPWAGLDVRVTLRASDETGQTGVSETLDWVLPERLARRDRTAQIADRQSGAAHGGCPRTRGHRPQSCAICRRPDRLLGPAHRLVALDARRSRQSRRRP